MEHQCRRRDTTATDDPSAAEDEPWYLEVLKGGVRVAKLDLNAPGFAFYLLGRDADTCVHAIAHASASRQHAVLQHDGAKIYLCALNSAHGTVVNKQRVKAGTYCDVFPGDVLRFGASTRDGGPEASRLGP